MIGRLLGNRYEIQEKIGGGGMSLVYRAQDIYLNRIVAIKVLREQFDSDEEFIVRFRREAQAVASLSHENIVSIYDVGQEKEIYYLVMEMVEGRNLKEIIKRRAPLSVREIVDLTKQICAALEHAHEHQIIHRDIKPHNIIITDTGKAKVTDFGIARAVSTATVTHTGSIMGSVHYFSPEQAKGEIANEKSDIYSLGVVLYEMATGCLPFEGDSPIGVALKKINADPIAPKSINPQLPEAFEKVILRAMDRNPALRYDSVRQLQEDLVSAYLYNRLEHGAYDSTKTTEDTLTIPLISRRKTKLSDLTAPLKAWTWVIAALILIGFLIGMYLSSTVIARGEVAVPNLVGANLADAENALIRNGLIPGEVKNDHHPSVAKGLIVSQAPQANEVVKKKSKIDMVVSEGPSLVTVPDVINNSLIAAEVALTKEGLVLKDISRVYNSQIPSGEVIYQEPTAGQEVMQGTAINLVVSRGEEPVWVKMPQLTGMTVDQAKTIIVNYQLTVGYIQGEKSDKYAKGMVIRQDPGADGETLQYSAVNLVVSEGPGPVHEHADVGLTMQTNGTLQIIVQDSRGRNVAYENYHAAGEKVTRSVQYMKPGVIEVYVNNNLIQKKDVE